MTLLVELNCSHIYTNHLGNHRYRQDLGREHRYASAMAREKVTV